MARATHPVKRWAIGAAWLAVGCAATAEAPLGLETTASPWTTTLEVDHPLTGRIYDVAAQTYLDRATLEARIKTRRFVLLGERHDHPDHHLLQAAMLEVRAQSNPPPVVAFEMIDTTEQPTLERRYPSVDSLGEALRWEASGWPPWNLYQPVFEVAWRHRLSLRAAGFDARRAMPLAQGTTSIDPALAKRHDLGTPFPTPIHAAFRKHLDRAHCGYLPESMVPAMLRVQRVRDAVMADALEQGDAGGGTVLIAGAGHVRNDWGVPLYLRRRGLEDVVSVAWMEVTTGKIDPEDYAAPYEAPRLPFDYVWFTPRVDNTDPCDAVKAFMERHRSGGLPPPRQPVPSPTTRGPDLPGPTGLL